MTKKLKDKVVKKSKQERKEVKREVIDGDYIKVYYSDGESEVMIK